MPLTTMLTAVKKIWIRTIYPKSYRPHEMRVLRVGCVCMYAYENVILSLQIQAWEDYNLTTKSEWRRGQYILE